MTDFILLGKSHLVICFQECNKYRSQNTLNYNLMCIAILFANFIQSALYRGPAG